MLIQFVLSVLDDDQGISEESFRCLNDLSRVTKDIDIELYRRLSDIIALVDAIDGRFYLKEGSRPFLMKEEFGC